MALVTLFMTGGHDVDMGDTGVELDCTCGCVDICAPDPVVIPDDTTPGDDIGSDPTPEPDICGTDVPEGISIACTTDAECEDACGDGARCLSGICHAQTSTTCTGDECGDLNTGDVCYEGWCYTLSGCVDPDPESDL